MSTIRSGRRRLLLPLWLGVATAIAASACLTAALTWGTRELPDQTEQLIAGTLFVVTVVLVTLMILWMARTSRHLAVDLRDAMDASGGEAAIASVAALAVGREGIETALFLWTASTSTPTDQGSPLIGALIGLGLAALLGWFVYRGALRLNLPRFFRWTGALLIFVAAGVLGSGLRDLQEAGALTLLAGVPFDVSAWIRPDSFIGTLLHGLLGFSPAPTWLQFTAWAGYAAVMLPRVVAGTQGSPGFSQRSPGG